MMTVLAKITTPKHAYAWRRTHSDTLQITEQKNKEARPAAMEALRLTFMTFHLLHTLVTHGHEHDWLQKLRNDIDATTIRHTANQMNASAACMCMWEHAVFTAARQEYNGFAVLTSGCLVMFCIDHACVTHACHLIWAPYELTL